MTTIESTIFKSFNKFLGDSTPGAISETNVMKRKKKIKMGYFYFYGIDARDILDEGVLKPECEPEAGGGLPILWFSSKGQFEGTPYTGYMTSETGLLLPPPTDIERRLARRFIRFGLPLHRLMDWEELKSAAGIPREVFCYLEWNWSFSGADHSKWYGTLEEIPICQCLIEWEVSPGTWRVTDSLEIRAWLDELERPTGNSGGRLPFDEDPEGRIDSVHHAPPPGDHRREGLARNSHGGIRVLK